MEEQTNFEFAVKTKAIFVILGSDHRFLSSFKATTKDNSE